MHCLQVNAPLFKPSISCTQHLTLIQSSVRNDGSTISDQTESGLNGKFNHLLTHSDPFILSHVEHDMFSDLQDTLLLANTKTSDWRALGGVSLLVDCFIIGPINPNEAQIDNH